MKIQWLSKNQLLWKTFLVGLVATNGVAQSINSTFNFTGSLQTFTVPCGVDSVHIDAWGAQGGAGDVGGLGVLGGSGGLGGSAGGYINVTPGDVLYIMVGGQGATPTGGFNGGANGGSTNAGGGGGASDVRLVGTAESDRVLTAGGGGGGGRGGCETAAGGAGGNGGSGGGGVGVDGGDSPTSSGVAGGGKGGNTGSVVGASGAAGAGCGGFLGTPGGSTTSGSGANGGAGQACCCFSFGSIPGGGGGGGGQIGGGGGGGGSAGTTGCSGNDKGAGGGGGGGSNYFGGVLGGSDSLGVHAGNGKIILSWEDPTPAMPTYVASSTSICIGDTVTYTVDNDPEATSFVWTVSAGATLVSGQNTNSISVVGSGDFTVDVYGVNGNCALQGPNATTLNVTVNALPTVSMSATLPDTLCGGMDVNLVGSPANGVFSVLQGSSSALVGDVFNAPSAGNYVLDYAFTDANGCTAHDTMHIAIDCMLGLDMYTQNGAISIYPNPAQGSFSLASDKAITGKLEIIDEMGRVVLKDTIKNASTKQIDLKNIATGTYTVRIVNGSDSYTGKLKVVK